MKITFLGTGTSQGIPVIGCDCAVCQSLDYRDKRLRTSLHLEIEGKSIVIDSGPDFRQQLLQNRIQKLDALLFTHEHQDHVAGLDDVRPFNYIQKQVMPIYAHERVLRRLRKSFDYAFAEEKYPGAPQLDVHELDGESFEVCGIEVTPVEVMHGKLPVFGFRFGKFAYVTDVNFISAASIEKLQDLDVLVLSALHHQEHHSHFTLKQACEMVKKIKPKQAFFTHFSHQVGKHAEIEPTLPPKMKMAYDGLSVWVED
ncbi:MAG: MBL fold metallo-hydrolase [Bacteroidota bacterium]